MLVWMAALPWWAWSLVANVAINVIEFLNRTRGYTGPIDAFKETAPLIVLAQIGLLYCWKGAPSMMLAWAFFSSMNALMRLVSNHFFVDEPLSLKGWLGVSVMFAGMYLVKTAR
jgi:multidrug transporter EmrE-like cation transporter